LSGIVLAGAAGVVFALLFVLHGFVRTITRTKVGFLDTLLAFLAVLVSLAALVGNSLQAPTSEFAEFLVIVAGFTLAVPSLALLMWEVNRQGWRSSRGVFGIGAGVMLLIAVYAIVPYSAQYFFPPPTATATSTPMGTPPPPSDTATITPTYTRTATNTPTRTPTNTRTPLPTPSPRPTRRSFPTRTPTETLTPVNPCVAVVASNLNLRTAPNTEAELITTIPFDTSLPVYGRNEDSTWWYVVYENQYGWVLGEYLNVTPACFELPVVDE
jgi:hypothetical protein